MVLRPSHHASTLTQRSSVAATAAMRSALESLQSRLDLVLDEELGGLTPEQRSFLAVASRDGKRIAALVSDIELVAHADEGDLVLEWSPCDLATLAHRAVEMVWPRAFPARKQIDLRVPGPVLVLADELRLADALLRLARLAVDATPEGGTIAIEVSAGSIELRYESDDVPEGDLALSVADAVARAHGGALSVASGPGTISLSLTLGGEPVAHAQAPVHAGVPVPVAAAAA